MIHTHINKTVDSEIEFKGYKGRYFYYVAGGVLGTIFLTFILYAIHVPIFITFPIGILLACVAIFYTNFLQKKYGKWGHVQNKHNYNFSISINKKFNTYIKH